MLDRIWLKDKLIRSLNEDAAFADETTLNIIDASIRGRATVVAKQAGVFSGSELCKALVLITSDVTCQECVSDGSPFEAGAILVTLDGSYRTLLQVERTLLNFLTHLCGIASLTAQYVRAVKGTRVRILATRKTLPGLRALELEAVTHGGGLVHRRSLSDGVLIKENHLSVVAPETAINSARERKSPLHGIEIEIQDLSLLEQALNARPDAVLLDNLSVDGVKTAIQQIAGRALIEISGGITLNNIGSYAIEGVDFISVGRLTHSAPACDLSMNLCPAN